MDFKNVRIKNIKNGRVFGLKMRVILLVNTIILIWLAMGKILGQIDILDNVCLNQLPQLST